MTSTRQPTPRRNGTVEERFWTKVQERSSGCWEWTGSRNPDSGYGRFYYAGKLGYAHRWSYEHFVGPIPGGATVDHICRNHPCVNPEHLDAVSQLENNRRGADRPSERGQVTETCVRGHLKSPENVYRHGTRYHCMTCRRDEARERYRRNRDAINARRRELYAARRFRAA